MSEEEFFPGIFAVEIAADSYSDFPVGCPLSCKEIIYHQLHDKSLQKKFAENSNTTP